MSLRCNENYYMHVVFVKRWSEYRRGLCDKVYNDTLQNSNSEGLPVDHTDTTVTVGIADMMCTKCHLWRSD